MTVYEKLAQARVRFQQENVKMSGENTFAKYKYYDLSDILPVVNRICAELKILPVCSFAETATLTVYDCESADSIVFTSPMSKAQLKGCHEVQNLGAVETYIKRYLYQNAFEIVEHDALDGTMDPEEKQKEAKTGQTAGKQEGQGISVSQAKATKMPVGKYKDYTFAEYLVADENDFYQYMQRATGKYKEIMQIVWDDAHKEAAV